MGVELFSLAGKTAVVVGGTSTLGADMALALATYGAAVAVVGRNMETAHQVCERIAQEGGVGHPYRADATNRMDLQGVLNEVLNWQGHVDILFNCPGVNSDTPFFEVTEEEWDWVMGVNLKSVVLSCQVFGQQMVGQGQGGSIVNISSVSSEPPLSRVFTYSASKAGVNSVTQYLARELAPHRIRVNAIVPGFFPAQQNRNILSPDRVESILKHTPMGRFGEASELQGTAVWLASERASGFVTGALIRVDGGFGAMTI